MATSDRASTVDVMTNPAMTNRAVPPLRPRVALYGHDTQGLGHLRRNLALAGSFACDAPSGLGADVLMLTGATEVGLFARPPGVESVVVPGVRKDQSGRYVPRRLRGDLSGVVDLRRVTLEAALSSFAPEVFVVDKSPWGFGGELAHALRALAGSGTRIVLGLRDVLDDPVTTARQWREEHGDDAVRSCYDEVWVYGDRHVHDLTVTTGMAADVAAMTRHLGYLSAGRITQAGHRPPVDGRPYVLATVGGGQDGAELATAVCRAAPLTGVDIVLLGGPQLPDADLRRLRQEARHQHRLHVVRFSRHSADWIAAAEAVISMGGANSVAEILDTDTAALIVPRTTPRREQLVRAQGLHRAGAVDMLPPGHLTPARLSAWLSRSLGRRVDRSHLDLGGLARATHRCRRLLPAPPRSHDVAV